MDNDKTLTAFTASVRQGLAHGMTRRAFLRRGLELGLSLPTVLGVLAACASGPPQPSAGRPLPTAAFTPPSPTAAPTAEATAVPTKASPTPLAATVEVQATATTEPSPSVRFAVIGDYGMAGEAEQAVAALVKSWSPEFIVTTGDNNYPDGAATTIDTNIGQYYHEFIGGYTGNYGAGAETNRFFPALGNHDWQGGTIQPYLDYFTLPGNERYYTFTWGPAQFFMLDSMPDEPDGVEPDGVQGQWLMGELAASVAPWKIVVMHHPPLSSGSHGSSEWMQWPYGAWGANVVLAGHDHTYERIERDRVLYIVNGLGGAARYKPGCCPVEGSAAFFNRDHGALFIEMDAGSLTTQFVTRGGEVVDRHVARGEG